MGFLLLMPFYPSVWSALKLGVLCCCSQRRSKDSPNAFPWGYLAWDFSREKEPLNIIWLYAFRDKHTASRIQSSGWERHPCPVHYNFSNTHTHTSGWGLLSYTDTLFFFWKKSHGNLYDMDWQRNGFYHLSTGKLVQKEDNASLFQGICSWKAMWNYRITLKLQLMVNNVEQRETELQDIRNFPVVTLLTAAGFGKISSPGILLFMPGLHSTSLFSARSWQAGRHNNPPSKMETSTSFYWSLWLFTEAKPGGTTSQTEMCAVVIRKAYTVGTICILMLLGIDTLGRGTSKKFIGTLWPRFLETISSVECLIFWSETISEIMNQIKGT